MEDNAVRVESLDPAEPSRDALRVARGFVYGLGISAVFWGALLAALFAG